MQVKKHRLNIIEVRQKLKSACSKTAPLWPLENFVAVNPYMGRACENFGQAMHGLKALAGIRSTLPMQYYLDALQSGFIFSKDIDEVLQSTNTHEAQQDASEFLNSLSHGDSPKDAPLIKTFAEIAAECDGKQWQRFAIDCISNWAAAYFDNQQAIWKTGASEAGLFAAWKLEASIDRGPDTMGLKGFRDMVKQLPDDPFQTAKLALIVLDIPENSIETYLQALLLRMPGWAGYAAKFDWEATLKGHDGALRKEFLAIQLAWELCLAKILIDKGYHEAWKDNLKTISSYVTTGYHNDTLNKLLLLQEAYDRANQRQLIAQLNTSAPASNTAVQARVQAIFCIDVRSEPFRRKLEAANDGVKTIGFAGFFAFPIRYEPLGHSEGENQCPVLLTPSHHIRESLGNIAEEHYVVAKRELQRQLSRAWHSFKLGAISCFSFMGPVGLAYLPKLILNAFGITRPAPLPKTQGLTKAQSRARNVSLEQHGAYGMSLLEKINVAESALRAMSMTENFSRTVLFVGHGASTVNNPHATGLDCGACGGHTGEANAKVAAAVLNEPLVRKGLYALGIEIPDTTFFMAALHDTTTDAVAIFNRENIPSTHLSDLAELEEALKMAGESCRRERASRLGITQGNIDHKVYKRSRDWAQVRPEWGLAGCSSFIVAPRERTASLNLEGKAFLHSYDWKKDEDFSILELIMTAPMVVTSWINLQYYASTVDNRTFGSGNKILHNVVGGLGVFEGYSGDLRPGLPLQSIHDGKVYQHPPLRLNVFIEAPIDEVSKILERHNAIRELCDHQWIFLFGITNEGRVGYRYAGNLEWEMV